MSEEIFAVVDENDEVIAHLPRSEVHRRRLRHRATHILVFNSHGQLLLQRRSLRKECSPGLWDSSAAGHVDRGESYDDCAQRELKEELGLVPVEPLQRLFKLEACAQTGWEFCWVYRCSAEGPFAVNTEEIDAVAWFTPAELSHRIATEPEKFSTTIPLIWARLHPALST